MSEGSRREGKTAKTLYASLGGKADQDMATLRVEDVAGFRNAEAKRVSRSSANHVLKIVRVFFTEAGRDGVVTRNVARLVRKGQLDSSAESVSRRAFTLPELKNILAQCDDEWRSLVLFGPYTGARLGDLAALTWQNLHLNAKELRFVTSKTGRQIVIPLAAPLLQHIEQLTAGDDPRQPLHPRAYDIAMRHGRTAAFSNQFRDMRWPTRLTRWVESSAEYLQKAKVPWRR